MYLKPGLYISRKDRKHTFVIVVMITSIDLPLESFEILFGASWQIRSAILTTTWRLGFMFCNRHNHMEIRLYSPPDHLNHSHSVKNGLETHEKGIVVCFYDVFFVGMCTLVRSRHMGKPNLNNACLF